MLTKILNATLLLHALGLWRWHIKILGPIYYFLPWVCEAGPAKTLVLPLLQCTLNQWGAASLLLPAQGCSVCCNNCNMLARIWPLWMVPVMAYFFGGRDIYMGGVVVHVWLQVHTALLPRRPTSTSSLPWEPQISCLIQISSDCVYDTLTHKGQLFLYYIQITVSEINLYPDSSP
jgi:hypothetical protein